MKFKSLESWEFTDNNIREALTEKAEAMARKLSEAKPKLSSTKLRQYYQTIDSLLSRIHYIQKSKSKDKDGKVREGWSEFYLLKAKAKYDMTRKDSRVPEEFYNFIADIVDGVNENIASLKRAKIFMEAVVGFFKEEDKNKPNRNDSNKKGYNHK